VLGEQQQDFVLQSRTGELLDQIRGGRSREQARCGALKAETEPLFEPDRSEDARGIVLETARMQHADRARSKIALPSIGVEHATELSRIQLYRYGIDREVPPGEILFDRGRLNRRQESGLCVGLSPGRCNIYLEPVWKHEPRRRKSFKHRQPCPIPVGHQLREGDPISLYREIKIPVLSPQQEIADDSADKVQALSPLIREVPKLTKQRKMLLRETTQQIVLSHTMLHGTPL
jgi:hypothetical protein